MRALVALAVVVIPVLAQPSAAARIDHILLGVPDLERTLEDLSKVLGVTPVYGGKHPGGTHNALLSLGPHTYLELIALQPGVKGSEVGEDDLAKLTRPEPVGWAVSAPDLASLRRRLARAGFEVDPHPRGSRTTPAGTVLHWQTFGLRADLQGAPFFIDWSKATPHPASTSPAGCTLASFKLISPDAKRLERLRSALDLEVVIVEGPALAYTLTLDCPEGPVTFRTTAGDPTKVF
ncbi:MAG: VOC family protein [Acidobacteriota bacterium]